MARRLDAALELPDRQLVDADGRPAGKVDDLELTDPGEHLDPPSVTAILTGPEALAGWLEGGTGRGWAEQLIGRFPGAGDAAR
jgi:hypothetical protein